MICADTLEKETMPAAVYIGWFGDIVITQEWTSPELERYLRIKVPPAEAVALAHEILRLTEAQ